MWGRINGDGDFLTLEEWDKFANGIPLQLSKLQPEFRNTLSDMFANVEQLWLTHYHATEYAKKFPTTANRLKVEKTDKQLRKDKDIFLKYHFRAKLSSAKGV